MASSQVIGAPLEMTTEFLPDNRCVVNNSWVYFETLPCNTVIGGEVTYKISVPKNGSMTILFGYKDSTLSLDTLYEYKQVIVNSTPRYNYSALAKQSKSLGNSNLPVTSFDRIDYTMTANVTYTFKATFSGNLKEKTKYYLALIPSSRKNNLAQAYTNGEFFYQDPYFDPTSVSDYDFFTRANSESVGGNWTEDGTNTGWRIVNNSLQVNTTRGQMGTNMTGNWTCWKIGTTNMTLMVIDVAISSSKGAQLQSYPNSTVLRYYNGAAWTSCGNLVAQKDDDRMCLSYNSPYQVIQGNATHQYNICNLSTTLPYSSIRYIPGSAFQLDSAASRANTYLDNFCTANNITNCMYESAPVEPTPIPIINISKYGLVVSNLSKESTDGVVGVLSYGLLFRPNNFTITGNINSGGFNTTGNICMGALCLSSWSQLINSSNFAIQNTTYYTTFKQANIGWYNTSTETWTNLIVNHSVTAAATAGTFSGYALKIQQAQTTWLGIGANTTAAFIQSFNSKPLVLNPAGNPVIGGIINYGCTTATDGAWGYNITIKKHVGCNGTSWNNLY